MTAQSTKQKEPRLAARLASEHDHLETWFQDLTQRAASGESRECDSVWNDFCTLLEHHMDFEERELFPRYAEQGAEQAAVVKSLLAEHAQLRRQMDSLGVDLQLHLLNAEEISALLTLLRDHARRERETLYPWLAAQSPRAAVAVSADGA